MATQQIFAVWAPYCTDSEMLTRRSDVRDAHLEGLKRIIAQGLLSASRFCIFWRVFTLNSTITELGGPTSDPVSGQPTGSMLVVEAKSIETLREVLENDPYWLKNVVRVSLHKRVRGLWCCLRPPAGKLAQTALLVG